MFNQVSHHSISLKVAISNHYTQGENSDQKKDVNFVVTPHKHLCNDKTTQKKSHCLQWD